MNAVFAEIKQLCNVPTPGSLNFGERFMAGTGASSFAVGAILGRKTESGP